ncbi:tRNA (N6-isopentenyl adenosine(37)-C2)-methylthiotransferase MiaB [Anaeromyxobacter diazotrophicus]|uniref:tRNA-2-methylthio-N(6)-dimethylallyladenosine synthase n=1 Tax=Anaeromyxobacter diazotrophicus TaxID=2590199 RepID=A0A7I9VT24_9BACT|nr:tRNA (N6-isopentenyl adenosine(37)-C2)-methylthiotransferase MiaB [Anaeromyxobacter diazotrophicus]GEJ59280.1 tRNA-2-methylthio-N(6)-dimethylallyladenosine synthase [Anaeromyxobacter diazotrophicus]
MRKVFVHTFGCQMNEADSSRMVELLGRHAFAATAHPEDADLILVNTCAVREKAEQKLLSALGRYRAHKARRGTLLAVGGCVAQQEKDRLLARVPYLDFVFGPDNLARLPEMIERAARERFAETGWMASEEYVFPGADPEAARGRATAFVTAMKGCDNVCSFCIVPHTRGREISRPYPEIVAECAALAAVGVREVTLIGQNVNSYAGGCDFAALLRRVAAVPDLARVRFTTSHPHDLSDALVEAFRDEPKVMPHFHLPVQSGSDPVLARMRRDYTVEEYLGRFELLRAARPGIAITTDFIVGFPGESDEDFRRSLALLERARFDNSFSFVYSPRPHTGAARRLGSAPEWQEVPREVAVPRLEALQAVQRRIASEVMAGQLGRTVEVLVEGALEGEEGRRFGRTPENRVVHLDADELRAPAGAVLRVRVTRAHANSLSGELPA